MTSKVDFRKVLTATANAESQLNGHVPVERLADYQDGLLSNSDGEAIRAHLAVCSSCISCWLQLNEENLLENGGFTETPVEEGEIAVKPMKPRKLMQFDRRVQYFSLAVMFLLAFSFLSARIFKQQELISSYEIVINAQERLISELHSPELLPRLELLPISNTHRSGAETIDLEDAGEGQITLNLYSDNLEGHQDIIITMLKKGSVVWEHTVLSKDPFAVDFDITMGKRFLAENVDRIRLLSRKGEQEILIDDFVLSHREP